MRYIWILFAYLAAHSVSYALPTHHIESKPRITVVGAGLAGLTAAYRLQKMGHVSEIYEARHRPGGRVLTAYFGTAYEELGGKNIYDGGDGAHILSLVEEMGLGTESHDFTFSAATILDGQIYTLMDLFKNAPEPSAEAFLSLKAKIAFVKSLDELIDPFFAENHLLRHQIEVMMSSWEGSAPRDLPPEYLHESFWRIYTLYHGFMREAFHDRVRFGTLCSIAGGNSRLVQALVDSVEGHIHYGKPLRKISKSADQKIWLHFDDESMWTDYLILALPCSTLRDVEIEEGLIPDDQHRAIRTLQYGTSGKIVFPIQRFLHTQSEWLPSEDGHLFFNKDHTTMTWLGGGQPGIFAIQDPAFASFVEKQLATTSQVFPDLAFTKGIIPSAQKEFLFSQYDTPVAISWTREEFSKGSYSNFGIGTFAFFSEFIDEFGESVRKVFRSVNGRIFFAGEHTAPQGDNGTMDGAVNSGERAARILDRILNEI